MIPVGPDVTLYAPTEDLTDTFASEQTEFLSNPLRRRKLPTLEHPALDLYAGYSDYLVKTAIIRSDKWKNTPGPDVSSAAKAAELTRHLAFADQEHIVVLALNGQNRLLAIHETSIGGASYSNIEMRQALKVPVLVSAAAVILVHNHPGGDPSPSQPDRELTAALLPAYKCLGIPLVDHVIIGLNGEYWSFFEHGYIN
jgi:DNA repair protein RadC